MNRPRVLYVPNESGIFRQVGVRRPLADLKSAGLVDDVSVFSLQLRIRAGGAAEDHRQDLIERVRQFRPSMILMQHIGSTGLTRKHFDVMRAQSDFELIYHEGDPYSRWLHPLPRAAAAAGRASDVTFTVGSGVFLENFRRAGATDVRWAPHVFEPERYGRDGVDESSDRQYDVVIVANRNSPRFRGHPNWKDRIAFVRDLQQKFGDRLAIYGKGWTGVGALGPIEPTRQNVAIQRGWISANWDHYATEPNYFSNRLPISLATGSIHATTLHSGYRELFPEETKQFLLFGSTRHELVNRIAKYLETQSLSERIIASKQAQAFAHRHYRQDDQIVSFLNYRGTRVDPRLARKAWDLESQALDEI